MINGFLDNEEKVNGRVYEKIPTRSLQKHQFSLGCAPHMCLEKIGSEIRPTGCAF